MRNLIPEVIKCNEEGSFAFRTAKDRWPVIVTKLVDYFCRMRRDLLEQKFETKAQSVAGVIADLSELRYRIATNKPLLPFEDSLGDVTNFNDHLKRITSEFGQGGKVGWFDAPWLFSECYLYRKIYSSASINNVQDDYFLFTKEQALKECTPGIPEQCKKIQFLASICNESQMSAAIKEVLKESLWSNQADFSLHADASSLKHLLENSKPDEHILADDSDIAAKVLTKFRGTNKTAVIILDNAGAEVLFDIFLALYLVISKCFSRVIVYGKMFPWFVSDVTKQDWNSAVNSILSYTKNSEFQSDIGQILQDDTKISYTDHAFWTSAYDYNSMKEVSPDLYEKLSEAGVVILKGDLNYRKALGDRHWQPTSSLKEAIRDFTPTNVILLRTLKAEVIAGLSNEALNRMKEKYSDNEWMVSGHYGVIQVVEKP